MLRRGAWAGVYLVAAVLLTWPLGVELTSRLGAPDGPGDPYLNVWILGWGLRAWTTNPASVLTGAVFNANIFHPAELTLAYSDHLLLQSLMTAPLYWATSDAVLSYNLLLLFSIGASGLAMHVCVRALTGSTAAALVAGLAWACWPYRTAHLIHLQLQSLYWLPLVFWALNRLSARRRWRDAASLGVLTGLQAVSSVYYGVMLVVALPCAALVLAWTTGQWRRAQWWTRLAAAGAIAAATVAPVAVPYLRVQQSEGFGRTMYDASQHAASVQSYTQVPPANLLYGRTGLLAPRAPAGGERDRRHVEHQMFPGAVLLFLAALGVAAGWRSDARAVVRTSVAVGVLALVLSLGPDGARDVYAWFYHHVVGFDAIRAPARFAAVVTFALCVLAGVGVARGIEAGWIPQRIGAGRSRGRVLIAVCAGLMMLEYANAPLRLAPSPARSTPVGRWLKEAPDPGAVLYLPLGIDRENTPYMVASLEHARPIVNGYSGQRPAFFSAVVDALSTMPSRGAMSMLRELDVRFVVSPTVLEGADDPASPLVTRAAVEGAVIYEVRWTDASGAALVAAAVRPPPPGPVPFQVGERLEYDVTWLSGPLDLTAGTITLVAGAPRDDERHLAPRAEWAFDATAVTAPWVARFFAADDRFRTVTDAAIEPLLHARDLREGRRHVRRAFAYDAAAGRVRGADTIENAARESSFATPLAPGARDALAALFYARTLDFTDVTTLDVPINEGGRGLVLRLIAKGQETIDVAGQHRRAVRLEPAITQQVARRAPVRLTVWLGTDERRTPLMVDLAAGFGSVRARLKASRGEPAAVFRP